MKMKDDTPLKHKPLIKQTDNLDKKLIEKTRDLIYYGEQDVLE